MKPPPRKKRGRPPIGAFAPTPADLAAAGATPPDHPLRAPGRPPSYRPDFPAMLLKHMAGGLSYTSFAGIVGCSIDTLYEWASVHAEFSEAKKQGLGAGTLVLERLGLAGITGQIKNFNVAAWIFTMKNRCGWRDRHETELTGPQGAPLVGVLLAPSSASPEEWARLVEQTKAKVP